MKAHSSLKLLLVAAFVATTGCIAQSGTEESSSQDLTATEATPQEAKVNVTGKVVQANTPIEVTPAEQQGSLHNKHEGVTAGSDPDPGGDDSTDEGDGQEPIPHPWEPHSSSSTYQR